jgi:hypothetical protein
MSYKCSQQSAIKVSVKIRFPTQHDLKAVDGNEQNTNRKLNSKQRFFWTGFKKKLQQRSRQTFNHSVVFTCKLLAVGFYTI